LRRSLQNSRRGLIFICTNIIILDWRIEKEKIQSSDPMNRCRCSCRRKSHRELWVNQHSQIYGECNFILYSHKESGTEFHYALQLDALTIINHGKATFTMLAHNDRLCFLQTIITEAKLDTVGTVEMFCKQMGQLLVKTVKMSGNILEFHQHVHVLTGALDSYGHYF
jgi:hypothetical protein